MKEHDQDKNHPCHTSIAAKRRLHDLCSRYRCPLVVFVVGSPTKERIKVEDYT